MPDITAIITSVDYDDLLAIALPRNARHFVSVLVVSDPADDATAAVVAAVPNAVLYTTNLFHADSAPFAKGGAIERAFDVVGRAGWICVLDADIVLPADMDLSGIEYGNLYSPYRRMLYDPAEFRDGMDWSTLPLGYETRNGEFAGYFQLFHAADACLQFVRPWYGTQWQTAQGCDTVFHKHWPKERKVRPAFEVLHLGEPKVNWEGRVTPRVVT